MQLRPFFARTAVGGVMIMSLFAVSGGAQASSHVGMRMGYNFTNEELMLSANLTVPMARRVEFYPSIDIYTPDRGNRIGFNGDVKVMFPMSPGPQFYVGGGLGVLSRTEGDFSNTDLGVNLLMGLESRSGWIHPFAEGKVLLHDRSQFQLIGGLNLTLGPRF
jgi:hypothetical protein